MKARLYTVASSYSFSTYKGDKIEQTNGFYALLTYLVSSRLSCFLRHAHTDSTAKKAPLVVDKQRPLFYISFVSTSTWNSLETFPHFFRPTSKPTFFSLIFRTKMSAESKWYFHNSQFSRKYGLCDSWRSLSIFAQDRKPQQDKMKALLAECLHVSSMKKGPGLCTQVDGVLAKID